MGVRLMDWKGKLKGGKITFQDDQKNILNEYFKDKNKCGRVAVSAGAGTGKTTLLVEIVSEAVVRLLDDDPHHNPFDKILAVTFTVEAARQMKTRIKERLEEHFNEIGKPEKMIYMRRWIENESWILTLDSLTRKLVSEIAHDVGLGSISTVPDEYELRQIIDDAIEEITSNSEFLDEIQLLESAFPDQEWRGDRGWISLLENAFQKSRMYCLSTDEFGDRAFSTFEEQLYKNYKPPFDKKKIREIYVDLRDEETPISPQRVNESYKHNKEILKAFIKILKEFERLYDDRTKPIGLLGHDDARHWVVRYAGGKIKNANYWHEWKQTQKNRFKHVLVDEFQDTSYAQCELLKYFIGDDTNVCLIGDLKQAIYQWRNAEPEIFIEILNSIPKNRKIPFLEADGFKKSELTSNFRSHTALINMFNDIFGKSENSIFNVGFYTRYKQLPHGDLQRKTRLPKEVRKQCHIHVYNVNCWDSIPDILESIKDREYEIYVRRFKDDKVSWQRAELGDCCILMQSRTRWPELRRKLFEKGINYVMIAEKGLFQRPEVSLMIDVLDWFANPHNKDSLIRILRSPVVGLSERSLRFLASHDFSIYKALKDNKKPKWFDREARVRLEGLIKLRDDLRWLREGRKTKMIEEVLKYSHLNTILLTHTEGNQCLANMWALLDIVSSWEQEELLPYNELVERLKYYRKFGEDAYNMAVLADEKDKSSIKIATVHAVKGLEFPIVFIYFPQLDIRSQWGYHSQEFKLFIKNKGKSIAHFIALKQTAPHGKNWHDWERFFFTEGALETPCSRMPPKIYDHFNREYFSEKWRLYYVALTRAKDHIFHNATRTGGMRGGRNYANYQFCWQNVFLDWFDRQVSNNCLEKVPSFRKPTKEKTKPRTIDFEISKYEILKKREFTFTPRVINPSHLYDLIFCPRRYQFVVLQQVSGGDTCSIPRGDKDKKTLFLGGRIHKALELRHLASKDPNKEYSDYIQKIRDKKAAKEVESAVDKFMSSDFFKDYKLDNSRVKKEMEILFVIDKSGSSNKIIMKDKIDLIIEDKDGFVITDYKTYYPGGNGPEEEYLKKHYEYQLQSYALALKGLGLKISKAIILSYDGREWISHNVTIDTDNLEREIQKAVNVRVEEGGLERKRPQGFCNKNNCEFYQICEPDQKRRI